jgi:hypothetical protein
MFLSGEDHFSLDMTQLSPDFTNYLVIWGIYSRLDVIDTITYSQHDYQFFRPGEQ